MAVTEQELNQALVDVGARKSAWQAVFTQLWSDAQAMSAQIRGRALPQPNNLGQLPAGGVTIIEHVGNQETGDVITITIGPDEVPWQNLANEINDTQALGASELDNLSAQLNQQLAQVQAQQQHGGVGSAPPAPTHDPQTLLPWADWLASIIAYGAVFYGLVAAAQVFSVVFIIVGVGLLALTGILQSLIIDPLRLAVRTIIGGVVVILQDLVDFFVQWVQAVLQYFQGDMLKAILRIVLLAFAMWIWEEAQKIPAIKGVLDWAGAQIRTVVEFVNSQIDSLTASLLDLRRRVSDAVTSFTAQLGDFGAALRSDILVVVDQLFGGLTRQLAQVRFEVLGQVDLVRAALGTTITVFGQRFAVLPEEVRKYLLSFNRAAPVRALSDQAGIMAAAAGATLTPADFRVVPWDVLAEMTDQMQLHRRGVQHDAFDRLEAVIADILAVRAGTPPDTLDLDLSPLQLPADETAPPLPGGA